MCIRDRLEDDGLIEAQWRTSGGRTAPKKYYTATPEGCLLYTSGKASGLAELLDEVPIDSARFQFNLREPGSVMDFDMDPVSYTHLDVYKRQAHG